MQKKLQTVFKIAGRIFISMVVIWGILTILLMKNYVDKTPKLTPKAPIVAEAGQTLSISDLFEIDCEGKYQLNLAIADTDITDVRLSSDKQSLFVGNRAGTITVVVSGYGEVAELVSAQNDITIIASK